MTYTNILDLMNQPLGAVATLVILVVLYRIISLFGSKLPKGIWTVATWKASVEHRLTSLENIVKELTINVNKLTIDVNKLTNDVNKLTNDVNKLTIDVNKLTIDVKDLTAIVYQHIGKNFLGGESPLTLTDDGISAAEAIKAEEIACLYAEQIKNEVAGMNNYEIQCHCFGYAKDKLLAELKAKHREHYDRVTDYLYQESEDVDKVMSVIGLVLRNEVLCRLGKATQTPSLPKKCQM